MWAAVAINRSGLVYFELVPYELVLQGVGACDEGAGTMGNSLGSPMGPPTPDVIRLKVAKRLCNASPHWIRLMSDLGAQNYEACMRDQLYHL